MVFEADTPAGKAFDVVLLWAIVASVVVAVVDSVASVRQQLGTALTVAEWALTAAFTVEYLLRVTIARRPLGYALSFYGLVDLLAILPTWISLAIPGAEPLLVVRALRLLRVFRVLRMGEFLVEAQVLVAALRASFRKITVFLGAVLAVVVIVGALMYVVEGPEHGYTDIPTAMYWAIVTLSTVGYGDIAPATPLGKFIASLLMVLGYGMIAVPTGIVSVEIAQASRAGTGRDCAGCGRAGHDADAAYCKGCGHAL